MEDNWTCFTGVSCATLLSSRRLGMGLRSLLGGSAETSCELLRYKTRVFNKVRYELLNLIGVGGFHFGIRKC